MTAQTKTAEVLSPAADLLRHTMHVLETGSGFVASIATLISATDMVLNGVSHANVAPIAITIAVVMGLTAMLSAHLTRD